MYKFKYYYQQKFAHYKILENMSLSHLAKIGSRKVSKKSGHANISA